MQSCLYQLHQSLYDTPERFIFAETIFSLTEMDIYFLGMGG